jgi:hypothetical protein
MRAMLLMVSALLIAGCGSTKESGKESQGASEDAVRAFEAGFQPSDHDPLKPRMHDRIPRRNDSTLTISADEALTPASTEMAQGFRVQVYSSTDIDTARAKKSEFEAAFPGEWFYLDYHAPSYKLRVGNFMTRFEAERFARTLTDQGYAEAWTVPEKVFTAPGKRKSAPPPIPPQDPPIKN